MTPIEIDAIKELREMTGARLPDCRAALEITEGDATAAAGLIRLQGTIHGFPHSLQTESRLRRPGPAANTPPIPWRTRIIQAAIGLPVLGAILHAIIHVLAGIFGFPCL